MIFSTKTAKWAYCNIDPFIEDLCSKSINLELTYESDYVHNRPTITLYMNGIQVYTELCVPNGNIVLSVPAQGQRNILQISMSGKSTNDTLIEDGQIVKDTFIKFHKFYINKYSLLDDYDFFYEKFEHVKEDDSVDKAMSGLWSNTSLSLTFDMPFDIWYNTVSKKNCSVSGTLRHQEAENIDKLIALLETSAMKLK